MLLALDLGMHCGWALFTAAGRRLASGTWHLGKDKVRGRYGELLLRLRTKVGGQGVRLVAYEHVHHHTGIDAGHVYGGWLAVLDMLVHATRVLLVPITTSEIHAVAGVKRARTPKSGTLRHVGNSGEVVLVRGGEPTQAELRKAAKVRRDTNKASTIEAARARGWAVEDDNEAEACFCGVAALAKRTGAHHG